MGKLTKNQKLALEKIEAGKSYSLKEASELVKEITTTKFDASVDIDVRLGVDPRKANQMVRGVVSLPNGTGKEVRVLALCTPDAEADAKAAGVKDGEIVSVKFNNERSTIFNNVQIRVDDSFTLEMHIDTDEANASKIKTGDTGTIV